MIAIRNMLNRRKLRQELIKESRTRRHSSRSRGSNQKPEYAKISNCGILLCEIEAANREIEQIRGSLTMEEKVNLSNTWRHLKGNVSRQKSVEFVLLTLERISAKDEKVASLFKQFPEFTNANGQKTNNLYEHARLVSIFFESLVLQKWAAGWTENLYSEKIGRCHACLSIYGFSADIWEVFGEGFAEALSAHDFVKAFHKAPGAWIKLMAILTDRIRAGFEKQIKEEKIKFTLSGKRHYPPTRSISESLVCSQATTMTSLRRPLSIPSISTIDNSTPTAVLQTLSKVSSAGLASK